MLTRIFGAVTGGRLNLRAAANSSAAIIASIPNETLLILSEYNDTWYAACYGAHMGFVKKQYIALTEWASAFEMSGTVTGGALNLRRTASISADRLVQIPDNTVITIVDFDANSPWYITDYAGYTGYVMKQYVSVSPSASAWCYGQVNVNELNVRRQPSISAKRWNSVWPIHRIVLIKDAASEWYESLYRGEPAYIAKRYINTLKTPVHSNIVDRMLFMAMPELGRNKAAYFNGYSGEWCHRFADWLAMNAGMPQDMVPNTSNCGTGIVWFINDPNSCGFYFKSPEHKARFISNYSAVRHLTPRLTAAEMAYVPTPGDYIYFRWANAASHINVSHVGIVAAVGKNTLTTWEGNSGSKVASRTFALNDTRIVGYGKPNYAAVQKKQQTIK